MRRRHELRGIETRSQSLEGRGRTWLPLIKAHFNGDPHALEGLRQWSLITNVFGSGVGRLSLQHLAVQWLQSGAVTRPSGEDDAMFVLRSDGVRSPRLGGGEAAFVVGFGVDGQRARRAARKWLRRSWWTPNALRNAGGGNNLRGVYAPIFKYSSAADAKYRVSIGERYLADEASAGTAMAVRTDWRVLEGRWAAHMDNVFVPASKGLPAAELSSLEPFDLEGLRPCGWGLENGWIVEQPSMSQDAAHERARELVDHQVGEQLWPATCPATFTVTCEPAGTDWARV